MDESSFLFLGLIFGSIGMGYLIYGIKQRRGSALVCGVLISILPYVSSNILLFIPLGLLFMALPIFLKL